MAASSPRSSATCKPAPPDFAAAVAAIPASVPRKHHGRNPQEGLDCVGLVLCVYHVAGLSIADLDLPYGERDAHRPRRFALIEERLLRRFVRLDRTEVLADGDVVIVQRMGEAPNHLGVVADGFVWHMDRVLMRATVQRMRPFVRSALRHQDLAKGRQTPWQLRH